ncbi:transglycosylase family protein [Garicola koreensis]|uniref:LysM repeat protein n=1 Tax=Garicola koreensis TaxID=1262554 RepID=A0A7W5XK42_9MICC|nr:transglycosylase family protein [Garicola koreensis]MBB3667112.1 LysM repeat protein [Garicola koreensis]
MKTSKTLKQLVGGSMAAATLAGGAMVAQAPVASASSDWDRLAECESGGDWSINTGNGFYGGLQFTPQSWQAAGGSGMPHQASKSEQIRVAENLQSMQGWGAWPSCSAQLGLSGDPSGGGAPAPEQQQQAPQQQQTQQAPQEQTQQAPQQEYTQPAPQPQQQTQPAPQPQQQSYAPAGDVQVSGETYTVASGDSLSSIAADYGFDWQALWGANADTIEDPNVIFVGDELKLPVVN